MDSWRNTSESLLLGILKRANLLGINFLYKTVKFWWASVLLFPYGFQLTPCWYSSVCVCIKFIMYNKIDDFLVLHFSDGQIIWDTTKACDLLKKSKKNCILCYISGNLLASKNVGKSSILLISSKFGFVFELCSLKMLLLLDEHHVYIFSG